MRLAGLTAGLTAFSLLPLTGFAEAHSEGAALQEEIVVTARRREESLLEIPVAVSTLNQNEIIERSIIDTQSLSAYTPGFTLQNIGQGGTSGRNNPNIRFRGLGVQASQPASRAGAIFWDGAYVSDGIGVLPLIDLERAEVIKGPQTAFFGRNTFAGAVNFIPARPSDEVSGRLIASYAPDSDGDGYEVTGAVGGPIGDSDFGYRVAGTFNKRGADYTFGDGMPLGEEETTAFWGTVTWDPTEALSLRFSSFIVDSSDTRALVTQTATVGPGECNRTYSGQFRTVGGGPIPGGDFTTDVSQKQQTLFCGELLDWDEGGELLIPVSGNDRNLGGPPADSDTVRQLPVEFDGEDMPSAPNGLGNEYEVWRAHFAGDYTLGNGYTISGMVSHGESGFWSITENRFGRIPPSNIGGFPRKVKDTTYELSVASPGEGSFRWQLGVNYYEQDQIAANYQNFQPGGAAMDIQEGDNLGIFGSVDWDITDRLTASFEGRWTEDTQKIIFEGPTAGTPTEFSGTEQSFEEFMPRVILSWQPVDSANLYGSYSKSYLQGLRTNVVEYAASVFDGDPEGQAELIAAVGPFTPIQELDAFEIGWKQQWGILDYSVAVYYMDWQNQTFFDLALPNFVNVNLAGNAEYTGLEVEWNMALTEWFTFSGGFNYVDAEFTDFGASGSLASEVLAPGQQNLPFTPTIPAGEQIDATGLSPRYISDTTGVFSFDFNFPIGSMALYARADALWTGDFYIDNFEWNKVDGYWKLNLRGGVEVTESLRAEIYGLNVTDDRSWLTTGGTTGVSFFGIADRSAFGTLPPAREIGIRLIANFGG
jgi:iron complex outermembrane receptor protein